MPIRGNPQFIEADVWKRAEYYSCTRKALEYIETSLDRPLRLGEIAAVACMERTAFSKSFRHKTGITFHEFVQAYRVSQAASRMEVSDCSITEVAFGVGFNSLDTFERVFKKIAGTTPSRYRLELLYAKGLIASQPNRSRSSTK
jgi:AraC-like DNA-binding protein